VNEFDAKRNEAEIIDEMLDFQQQVVSVGAGVKGDFTVFPLPRRLVARRLYAHQDVAYSAIQSLSGFLIFRLNRSVVTRLPISNDTGAAGFNVVNTTNMASSAVQGSRDCIWVNAVGVEKFYIPPFNFIAEVDELILSITSNITTGTINFSLAVASQRIPQ
jgi:hypothetical protein